MSRVASEQRARVRRTALSVLQHLVVLTVSLLIASLLIFLALHFLPGDAASILAGTEATPEQVALLSHQMGLDRPVMIQYFEWIGRALTGDLGISALDNRPVAGQLGEKLQVTLPLILAALSLSIVLAIPLGMVAGAGHQTWYGQAISTLTQFGVAVPTFVTGLFLVSIVSVQFRLLPAQGFPADRWEDPQGALRSLVLPTVTLAIPLAAGLIRFVRSATIELLSHDWIRTARAQGWSLPAALVKQGLRNAALPLVAVIGLELAGLLMGSVLVERVFSLPGIGQMILQDVGNRDINKVQGTLLLMTGIVMILTVSLSLLHGLIDPRMKARR